MENKEPEECTYEQEGTQRQDEDGFWEECLAIYDWQTGAAIRFEWGPMPEASWWDRR